jgi:hypothetical protein
MPVIDLFLPAHGDAWLWVPVGIRGSVGARYIVVYIAYRTPNATYGVLAGAEVLRFVKGA